MSPKLKFGPTWGAMVLLILAASAAAPLEPAATAPAPVSSGWPAPCAAYVRIVGYCADRLSLSNPARAQRLQSSVEKLSVQWMDDVAQHREPTVNGMDCTIALNLFTRVEAPIRGCGGDDLPLEQPAHATPAEPPVAAAPPPPAATAVPAAPAANASLNWPTECEVVFNLIQACIDRNRTASFAAELQRDLTRNRYMASAYLRDNNLDALHGYCSLWGELFVRRSTSSGWNCATSTAAPGAEGSAARVQTTSPADFTGQWTSNFGNMRLWQSRYGGTYEQVSGTFGNNNGRIIDGQAQAGTVTGIWTQNTSSQLCNTEQGGSNYWGGYRWTLSADGRSFEGSWGYCDGPLNSGTWNGTRVGDSK